ncbi:MAG: putative metal-binding motif-containing protein [Polyangiales bacterium]|nr:putative metal-binding motif-containing protein [Myxococcales bacterium]MCB9657975.1 putative metal-binding motif-containing protein [Sandaracinaceae bacterium]
MRRISTFSSIVVLAWLPVLGCSFVAVEDIDPDMTSDPADCVALNDEPSLATGDPCLRWQLVDGFCRIGTRDTDGDGAKDAECAAADEVVDCDEEDPTRAPQLAELCDGVDNDCDERVDEDVLTPTTPSATQVATGIENASFAAPPASARVAALFSSPDGTPQHVVTTARFGGTGSGTVAFAAGSVTAPARDGATRGTSALAALDSQSYVAALVPAGGCRRVALATLGSDSASTDLSFPAGHADAGLPDVSGETCLTAGMPTDQRARTPALAASTSRVLAAWVAGAFLDTCGVSGSAAPVVVNGATFNANSRVLTPGSAAALSLGSSHDASGPAVIALGADGFVVAHADGSDVVLSRVSVDASGVPTLAQAVRHDVGDGLDVGDVALVKMSDTQLLLAYRVGCGTQARVITSVQSRDANSGELAATLGTARSVETGSSAQRRPQLAVRELPVGATVVWEVGATLRTRQLDGAGVPLGAVQTAYSSPGTLGVGHYVYPLPDAAAFGLLVAEDAASGGGALQSLELRCSP